jgi:hypothetical protein
VEVPGYDLIFFGFSEDVYQIALTLLCLRGYGRCERLGNFEAVCNKPKVFENVPPPLSGGAWPGSGNSLLLSDYRIIDGHIHGITVSQSPAYSWAFVAASEKLTTPYSEITVEVDSSS